jgi:S-adenosylmethionine:tRNA ribosyltransferase-isomerase
MNRNALLFNRPDELAAQSPPERRGLARDEVRLLVSSAAGHIHSRFTDLAEHLDEGDLLVVNESATLPASLPAVGGPGRFMLNLSTRYGAQLWLAEPRWSSSTPGPMPIHSGDRFNAGGLEGRFVGPFPGLNRLWFVHFEGDAHRAMNRYGKPIVYGYIRDLPGLDAYQTLFSKVPGSAEMPSAARPFTGRVVDRLAQRGVQIAPILLHTGVSSLEIEAETIADQPLYPEPFQVSAETAAKVNQTKAAGKRVIAVGTTVVRALESSLEQDVSVAAEGFTRLYLHPDRRPQLIDGLITGLHDPITSHLAMMYAIAGTTMIDSAYVEAIRAGYLWHEFGDTHLILPAGQK